MTDTAHSAYAHQHAASLPGDTLDQVQRTGEAFDTAQRGAQAQDEAHHAEKEQRRESFMVRRDHPQPVLRPSPALAYDADRAAFAAQWSSEYRDAEEEARAQRKEAFVAQRQQSEAPAHEQSRSAAFNHQARD